MDITDLSLIYPNTNFMGLLRAIMQSLWFCIVKLQLWCTVTSDITAMSCHSQDLHPPPPNTHTHTLPILIVCCFSLKDSLNLHLMRQAYVSVHIQTTYLCPGLAHHYYSYVETLHVACFFGTFVDWIVSIL